jgi:hypothetical protein
MKFHNLRHSVLTILADMNEDPNAICNLARHADQNFMNKTYLHPTSKLKDRLRKNLKNLFQLNSLQKIVIFHLIRIFLRMTLEK